MLWRHNFKISFRNILKHSSLSFSVIVGFSLSISITLPILLLRINQSQYDHAHRVNSDLIFRVTTKIDNLQWAFSPPDIKENLRQYPFVKFVMATRPETLLISLPGALPYEVEGLIFDREFADVFRVSDEQGMAVLGTLAPFQIALSKPAAQLIFGDSNPIGKEVWVNTIGLMTVASVLSQPDEKNHISASAFIASTTIEASTIKEKWSVARLSPAQYHTYYHYVVLSSPEAVADLQKALDAIDLEKPGMKLAIQPCRDILGDRLYGDTYAVRAQPNLSMLGYLGIGLFLLATFNYITLTITRAITRNQEIGVKRIFGASRLQIFSQLIVESLFLALFSTILGLLIMLVLPLPYLKILIDTIDIGPELILMLICYGLVVGFAAGIIPAWLISKPSALQSIRNSSHGKRVGRFTPQALLLTVQFTATLIVLIVLFAFTKQTAFMATSQREFKTKGIFAVKLEGLNYELLRNEANSVHGIYSTCGVSDVFGSMPSSVNVSYDSATVNAFQYFIDRGFTQLFGLTLVYGKDLFSESYPSCVLVNETAVKALMFERPEDAVGQTIQTSDSVNLRIAGVIRDFRYDNFKRPINPLLLRYDPSRIRYLFTQLSDGQDVHAAFAELSDRYKKKAGVANFDFENLDQKLRDQVAYRRDISLLSTVSIYACCIALLTLFAMTIHTMTLRSKEISIRKVYGASLYDLLVTLSGNYFVVFVIALMIAVPLAFVIVETLLQEFVAKFPVTASLYIIPSGGVLSLIAGIVITQAMLIARRNQMRNLRSE